VIPVDRDDAPALSYDSDLSAEDWEYIENTYVQLGLNAVQLAMAGQYGIVTPSDPISSSNKTLLPEVDPGDAFLYHVRAGGAVTQKGQFTYLAQDQDLVIADANSRPLADGQLFVIVLRYLLIESDSDKVMTHAGFYEPKYTRLAPPEQRLQLLRLEDYQTTAPSALYDAVALGVLRITSSEGALTTTLTITRDAYPFNRPWFSPVDAIHRASVGSGTVTATNPHGYTLADLDVGPIPLFQLYRTAGTIIAKDWQYPRCAGNLTREVIKVSSLYKGVVARLTGKPVVMGRLIGNTTGRQLAYYYDPIYNAALLLNPISSDDTELTLEYTTALSLVPRLVSQTVRVGKAESWEAVIAEGRVVPTANLLADQDVDLSDSGGAVQPTEVYVAGDGVAFRNPQTLLCNARINKDFAGGLANPTAAMVRLGLPRLLITDRVPLTCTVTLTGTDYLGQAQTDIITVDYTPEPISHPDDTMPHLLDSLQLPSGMTTLPAEIARQRRLIVGSRGSFFYATKLFASISTVRIDDLQGGTTDAALTLQAILDSRGTCKVASLLMVDHRPTGLVDARDIDYVLRDPSTLTVNAALTTAATAISTTMGQTIYTTTILESLARPLWMDVSNSLLDDNADESAYYKSRAVPINPRVQLSGSDYNFDKSFPSMVLGNLPDQWRHLLTPEPAALDWRVMLGQTPIFQWVWEHLHSNGIFRRFATMLPQYFYPNGGAVGNTPTGAATHLAVQCLGQPEWARLTFTRYGNPDGSHEDDTYVLDGPRWVTGTIINLMSLPWSLAYTKSLCVELRGKELPGYVVVIGREEPI
jgi:hypothetical protein